MRITLKDNFTPKLIKGNHTTPMFYFAMAVKNIGFISINRDIMYFLPPGTPTEMSSQTSEPNQ